MKEPLRKDEPLVAVFLIAAFYGFLHLIGINCPIRFLTGISCPGCGMTRAWISFLHGDLLSAFDYHPLFFTMVPTGIVFLLRGKIPKRWVSRCAWLLIALFFAVYLYRMCFSDGSIVSFLPKSGLIYKALHRLL